MLMWCDGETIVNACHSAGCSTGTAFSWYNMIRDVCRTIVSNDIKNTQIGGENRHDEIDETFKTHRKNWRGRKFVGEKIILFQIYRRETEQLL